MPSPFPGMDPYLEGPAFWFDFHARFIILWSEALADVLPDHCEARINGIEDDERHERWIEILHRPDRSLVAVLELLSPTNKEEPGRRDYLAKRNALVRHPVHLVELDLLMGGRRLPLEQSLPTGDYYALVSRGNCRPECKVYAWTMRQPLPAIPIPLMQPDPDIWLDLAGVFATVYERGRYARSLNYAVPPPVALDDEARQWVMDQVQGRNGRG